jgi:hypothetical protein
MNCECEGRELLNIMGYTCAVYNPFQIDTTQGTDVAAAVVDMANVVIFYNSYYCNVINFDYTTSYVIAGRFRINAPS